MLIGYARVSTHEQNLDLQRDALSKIECERIFEDTMSGMKDDRPGLEDALSHLRLGDTLVVWKLDRLGRSQKHLFEILFDLDAKGIYIKVLSPDIDTTTSVGKLVISVLSWIAEDERERIKERTLAGLASARARGRKGGRPVKHGAKKVSTALMLAETTDDSIAQICESLSISRATYYRALNKRKAR